MNDRQDIKAERTGWSSLADVEFTEQQPKNDTEEQSEGSKQGLTEIEKGLYRYEGVLTPEDIEKINLIKNKSTIILDNTRGLSSEQLKAIDSEVVFFSIKGGLDYEKKNKYDSENYKSRTMLSPKGLEKVVGYFESVEKEIDPEWTDLQKAMYAYNCLAVDMDYVHEDKGEHCDTDFDDEMGRGTIERSLNGVLYGRLICAGFALTYQEMMDRLGIESHYQNQKDIHAYNVVSCDGKYYGVDVTWDSVKKDNMDGRCGFSNFGVDEEFYSRHGHKNYREEEEIDWYNGTSSVIKIFDEEEERFPLSTLSGDEMKQGLQAILPKVAQRNNGRPYQNFPEQSKETKARYLPIDTVGAKIEKEANRDYEGFVIAMDCLKEMDALSLDERLAEAIQPRRAYVMDMYDHKYGHKSSFSEDEIEQCERIKASERRGEIIDSDARGQLVDSLNSQLTERLGTYLDWLVKNTSSILNEYEYAPDDMDDNRHSNQIDRLTKLTTILRAKDYLIDNGYNESEIAGLCDQINEKIQATHGPYETQAKSDKEYGLDFLGGTFANLRDIRESMEQIEGAKLSDADFYGRLSDIDYILNSVYPDLDLSQYDVTKDEFAALIKENLLRSNQS